MSLPHPPSRPCLEPLEDRLVPASLPPGFFESAAATGLTNPTAMEFSPDGRLFVLEQAGTAQVWQGGARLSANFFAGTSLNASSVDSQGERGLLGIAFDPAYSANHFVYVYYTAAGAGAHNRVSRFTADPTGLQAVPGSEKVLLELDPLTATTHNGGAIHFGPDGMLYVGVGEGGNTPNKAQDLTSLFGKVLRLDAHAANIVPPDNPFVGVSGARGEIWALGLRNPFSFTAQPGIGIFVNDVGQSSWEEVDNLARGANYGWPATEGYFDAASFPGFTEPFYAYPHPGVVPGAPVTGGAITGGAFYLPATSEFPADYSGDYFFADFVSGWIRRIDLATHQVSDFASGVANPVDLRVSADGALYYLARGQGEVFRVDFAAQGPLLPDGSYGTASQRFVAALYRDLLGRPLTLAEMQNGAFGAWVSALDGGWSNARLVAAFEDTAEARTFALDGLYLRYLGRAIDPAGQGGWLNFLAAGGTYEQVEGFLVSSPEFLNAHGGDPTAVLDAIYRAALDRPITGTELAVYVDGLARGATLGQIGQGIMVSAEHHHVQVIGWYQRFLLRTPTEDVSGWVNELLAGRRDELVLADILGAPGREYYNRVTR